MVKTKLATLALASVLSVSALPALADSAFFSFSVGDTHGYRSHHGGHHGRHHGYYERERFHHWGSPVFFGSHYYERPHYVPSPIVYYEQPTVIERRVIVEEQEPIRATRGRVVSDSPYCREYQRNVTVGNHVEQSYGTACRQPDGAWKVVSDNDYND